MPKSTLFVRAIASSLLLLGAVRTAASYDFVVATDSAGQFHSVQEAVMACRDYPERDYTIFVKNGTYREKLTIPTWKTRITIMGENVDSTIIVWDDYSGRPASNGKKINTFTSFTCLVAGSRITIENITFVNSAGRVGQAVALHVEGDRCVFRNCKLKGNQDTLFAGGENSRQYFVDCTIEGTTDFIFGPATVFFERCTIRSKTDSYITAASTLPTRDCGFVFRHCSLFADSGVTRVYLGRPWRLYAYTAFVDCSLGRHILPQGWHNWSKPEAERTARYYEYRNAGPGANPSARVTWSRQLTDDEAAQLTPERVLAGQDNWNPTR
jgi:pectinesterase